MKELDSILKSIKNKTLQPVYFFHGEEAYYIDTAVRALESDILEEDEKAFNQTVLYGKDTTYGDVISLARQFPMMGDRQVIIVKEAQDLKLDGAETALTDYVENPSQSTVLVFAHKTKTLDGKKRKLNEVLKKNNFIFRSDKLRDYELPKFIQEQLKSLKIQAAPNIAQLISEYLGNDLSRIANELHKLKMLMRDGEILDEKLVEKHIGISKEFNVFELQEALGLKNAAKAMRIAHFMAKNPKSSPIVLVIGNLYSYFSNLIIYHSLPGTPPQQIASEMGVNPYFIKNYAVAARYFPLKLATRVISILRETDLKSKGLGANQTGEGELLIEMVYKILNVDRIAVKI